MRAAGLAAGTSNRKSERQENAEERILRNIVSVQEHLSVNDLVAEAICFL